MMKILTNCKPSICELNHDFRGFDGKPLIASSLPNNHLTSLDRILSSLPADWVPDVMIFKSPMYHPIPYGIEDAPFPTVALLDDWFGAVDYLPDNLRRFDFIYTDKYSVELLQMIGFDNVVYWPCFGYQPQKFRRFEGVNRDVDVSFAGSLNINIQIERLHWLRRLCRIDSKYAVGIYCGLWGEDYVNLLNRTKIVFNRTIKGEMNLRAFEAPACGALLFIEEENREIHDFFEPGKECVTYNNRNLEDLLYFYLSDHDACAKIAEQGFQKAQFYSYPKLFEKLLEDITSREIPAGSGRTADCIFAVSPDHRDFIQVSLSLHGRSNSTVEKIRDLVKNNTGSPGFLNDCAVILAAFVDDRRKSLPIETRKILYQLACNLLDNVYAISSDYRCAQFNKGQILYEIGDDITATKEFESVFNQKKPAKLDKYNGIVFPVNYHYPLRTLWSVALSESCGDFESSAKERQKVLRFMSAIRLGDICRRKGDFHKAVHFYDSASRVLPNHPASSTPMAMVSQKCNNNSTCKTLDCAIAENPFNTKLWELYASELQNRGKSIETNSFIDDSILCLQRLYIDGNRDALIALLEGFRLKEDNRSNV